MSAVIIDYGSGNLRSVAKACQLAAQNAGLACPIEVSGDPLVVRQASRVILPGVGAFADCKRGLLAVDGLGEALEHAVVQRGVPFLGICVGMQLLADVGREHETCPGLGWIGGQVVTLAPTEENLKIPHMGWNTLTITRPHPLFDGVPDQAHVYFVHSYVFDCADPAHCLATTDYGGKLSAAVGRDNLVGLQFHPEKSQAVGLRIIENFLRWLP